MVFSGIVRERGRVVSLEERDDVTQWDGSVSKGTIMVVAMDKGLEGSYVGCSIAINGVCLTATVLDAKAKTATFGLAPETLSRSNLGALRPGSLVNVEPSLKADAMNSGHYVQGHVDGTGVILEKRKDKESLWVRIGRVPEKLMAGIVEKGYIAVDGTSLTVCRVNSSERWFELMLVSHTQQIIVLPLKEIGETVNLEVDVMGKYAARASEPLKKRMRRAEVVLFGLAVGVAALAGYVLLSVRKPGSRDGRSV